MCSKWHPSVFLKQPDKVFHQFLEIASGNLAHFSYDRFLELRNGLLFVLIHSILEITSHTEVRSAQSRARLRVMADHELAPTGATSYWLARDRVGSVSCRERLKFTGEVDLLNNFSCALPKRP